ncbi:MAG: hypothetical protein QGM50_12410 [Anaerolineae bacterium]|nr:hypothetical protein [Anaerolineae bacterium]
MIRTFPWPFCGLGLVALSIGLFSLPTQIEGSVLLHISPGHALSVLDSIALVPLLIGSAWLQVGLWHRRERLYHFMRVSPRLSGLAVFAAGLGVGLLLASAFSSFWWWWAIGAVMFGLIILIALLMTAKT